MIKSLAIAGFCFMGGKMVDLVVPADFMATVATLQGAQIQAKYTLWAAIVSSIIGAFGIVFAAWYAWQGGVKLHQYNNIIEAKREVYLDVIAKYQQSLHNLKLLEITPNKFYEFFFTHNKEFFISINKAQLICNENNREAINGFCKDFEIRSNELITFIDSYIESHNYIEKQKLDLNMLVREQDNLWKNNPNILMKTTHDDVVATTQRLSNIQVIRNNLSAEEVLFSFKQQQIREKIQKFECDMSLCYENVRDRLRGELKILE